MDHSRVATMLRHPSLAAGVRDDGTFSCCGGYGEHFIATCDVGREIRRLERALMARDVVRRCEPARPALAAWEERVRARLDELDAGDRAWVAWSEER